MKMKKNTSRLIRFVVYLIVVVLINIAGLSFFFRADLTTSKAYSLSNVSKNVVSTLSEPMTVNVFFTKNLPAPYNTVERYLRDLLDEYSLSGGKNFNFRFFDVTPEDEGGSRKSIENRQAAQDYGLYPVQIQAIEKDEVKFRKAYMGLVIIHGDLMERIPTITSTEGLEYKITTSVMKLNNRVSALLKLKTPVEVKLYISPSMKEVAPLMGLKDLPQVTAQVKGIIEKLNRKMFDRLLFSQVEPEEKAEMDRLVKAYNLMYLSWPDIEDTPVKAGQGVIGLVMELGGTSMVLPVIQVYRIPLFGTRYTYYKPEELEEMISQNISSLIGTNESIGFLADHGTLQTFAMPGTAAREPITNFDQLASQNYSLRQVRLAEAGIPKGLKSLVIAGPTENFTDHELFQIDQALMQGTSLALFIDRFREVPMGQPGSPYGQQSQFIPLDTGLEKLLDHYGVKVSNAIVLDEKCFRQRLPVEYGGGEQPVYFAPIIQAKNINTNLPWMENIKALLTVAMSPVEIDEKRITENRIAAVKLFSSSERSWEMRDTIMLNPMMIKPPVSDKDMRSRPLAYLLEGSFKSYFNGRPIPEKLAGPEQAQEAGTDAAREGPAGSSRVSEAGGFLAASARPGRIFLVGSSHMLMNNLLEGEGQNPNETFLMNMLDVLNDRQDIALMRSKTLTINPLDETPARVKMFIKSFNIAGVPSLVVGAGLIVWARRRLRKKRIEAMFERRANP